MLFAGNCNKAPDKKALRKKAGGWSHPRKGGEKMPITLTFHILHWTVTVKVKSGNRHSAK